ncbi:hypothetical protein D910_09815 [Dendroctonus ponderosae]|uniref:Carbohydrate kinase PfkB domain-containing protein n=1 Tax=Dendroctonus ponderosae TaxID=77166 RepID=U4UHJ8_DENPD|nr:hypothetical protein D910_09815 [Dendroctonus ponderosae]KAH1023725.1 hypothetical protein HUJ05_003331 [Dendroctonus ponderosae]
MEILQFLFYEPTDIGISRKPFKTAHWRAIKFITPNIGELHDIANCLKIPANLSTEALDKVAEVAESLACYIDNVLVTMGPEGVLIARKGSAGDSPMKNANFAEKLSVRHYPVHGKTEVINVSGAGDCFASGFIAGLLQNCSESQCVSVGFAAAVAALKSRTPVPEAIFKGQRISGLKEAEFIALH